MSEVTRTRHTTLARSQHTEHSHAAKHDMKRTMRILTYSSIESTASNF